MLFERGLKEAIYIRALNPSPNSDGRRYKFVTGMGQHHQEESEGRLEGEGRRGGWLGHCHHRLTQRPKQHRQNVRTEEADKNQRKLLWVERFILYKKDCMATEFQ